MRNKPTSLRTLLGALLVAGGMIAACSSRARHSDTTVAQAPLGQSQTELPSNPSIAPPDAAETAPPPLEHAQTLSHAPASSPPGGAAQPRGTAGAPAQSNNPNATANGTGIRTDTDRDSQPATPVNPGTPTNPATPAPTPASPNAPSNTPAPNPIPPSNGTGGTTNNGGGTSMSTVPAELGTFREPLDPYQTRSDGGLGSPLPRGDAGVTPLPRDAGPISRSDAAIVGPTRDGGIR